ncbi:MAG: fibronectin type III domain-containing protein, partial [Bacteroidales bacterium]|nr:fibronectin type III domain-containing protein [Bacteroidales bacterium]
MRKQFLLFTMLMALMVPMAVHAQTNIPYLENFESYTNVGIGMGVTPTDWTVTTGANTVCEVIGNSSGKYLRIGRNSAISSTTRIVTAELPSFSSNVRVLKLTFKLRASHTSGSQLQVGYINRSGTFQSLEVFNPSDYQGSQYISETVDFNRSSIAPYSSMVIQYTGNTADALWFIDNVQVTFSPKIPNSLTASNVTGSSADLSWSLVGRAEQYQVEYADNASFSNAQSVTASNTSITLSDLSCVTEYYARVRSVYGSSELDNLTYSNWSNVVSFTTSCAVPTNVQVYANPAEGVTVSWEGNANSYHIQYENIETWQSAYHNGLVTTTGNSYTFTGNESVPVVPGMRYILRVQAQCDPSTASEWSEWVEFTNCLTYMDLPLHANFDYIPTNWSSMPHADLPGCWSRINDSDDPDYSIYPLVENNQNLCHSSYYALGLYNYIRFNMPANGPEQYLVLPPVDPVNDVTISFWVRSASQGTSYSYNVGLMPNNYSTNAFYVKDGYNFGGSNTDYIQNTYTFSAEELTNNGNYIVIWARSYSDAASSFCIDDIDIYPADYHCGEPVNVHAENIGATSAQIVWQNPVTGGGEWGLKYKKDSDVEWTVVTETGIVSLNYPLENLDANTLYDVAVRNNCNDIDHSEWVEASFTTLDVIPVPTNLHVITDYLGNQHVGSSWVDLAWDCTPVAGQSAVNRYGLEVSDDGETWYGPQPNAYWGTVATQCIVDPISTGTHYVRVRAMDSDYNEGDWSEPLQFTIEGCNTVVTIRPEDPSVTYDFNECPPLPDCWTVYGDIPYGISINYNALYFDFRDEVEAKYVELEEFLVTGDYSGLVVSFDWRHMVPVADNTTNMTVQLQYCLGQENENWQDAGEPISVFKDGLTEPQWSTYTRMIPYDYWTRLRLKYTVTDYQEFSYGTYPYCLIDNLVVSGRPYCANPTKWRVVPETYGGRVIWNKVAAAISYDIAYQVDGDGDWESVEDVEGYEYTADSLFFDLTGLQANTTYRVNIKSECSNQWPIAIVTFTTSDFGSFDELMYTFEEGMPADFSVSGAGAANVSVSTEQSFGADPHSLKYDFVSGSPYPSQALAYVEIGNCLNTRGFNDFLVYFDMYCTDVASTYETVYMQYKAWSDTDGWEENWRSVGTWYTSYDSQGWVERHDSFSIPNELQGTVSKLRFRLIFTDHGSGENTYIDNIRIFPKGSCNNVSRIDIDALESTSATFRWNDPNYEAGTTQSVGFTIRYRNLTIPTETYTGWIEIPVWVDASNPTRQYSITLNELDPSSSYLLSIRAICPGIGYTEWLSPNLNFGTQCQAYKLTDMQPFTEDFDNLLLNPACWTYTTNWNRIYDGYGGHNWCLRSNYNPVAGWSDYIDTPEIELDPNYVSKGSSYLVLRFWTKCSGGDGSGNKVKVLVGNQEVEIYEMPAYGCDQWQQVDLSLSRWLPDNNGSNTISVRFDHGSDATAEWFIDDVVITSWDQANYGTRVFDDAFGNDWTNNDNWYPNGAPSYSPSMDVTLMGQAWVLANSELTVGTLRFGTLGYLDVQPGSNLTITEVDIPEAKVFVEPGATLNIGTAHFGFDKIFTYNEGTYNITNLNVDDHCVNFNNGTVLLNTVTLTAPGWIVAMNNTLNVTTVNSSGLFEVISGATVNIGTLNAAEGSPFNVVIEGSANITTLNANGSNSVMVRNGGMLNATTINSDGHDRLVIEDGGQVKSDNAFYGIIEKNISGYGAANVNDRLNWYLIASPIDIPINDPLVPLNGTELDFDKMDLYRFNPYFSEEWRNEKCTSEGGCDSPAGTYPQGSIYGSQLMVRSTGYLYSSQDDMTVNFSTAQTSSSFSATDEDVEVDINYDNSNTDVKLAGMNLIGNPYTCNAYLKQDGNYIPFYKMNATGDAIVGVPAGTPIKPCEGVFVCCTESSSTVIFTTEPAGLGENPEYRMVLLPTHTLYEDQDASPTTLLIGLYPGWNWIAPSVEVIVAAMQDELGSDAVICEEENIRVIAPGQMVKVHVAEEGTYELSGRT